jgi:alanine racemase
MDLTVAEISLKALKHNLERVRSLAPDSKVLAMIKADAYGHGIEAIAKALPDADALGVARVGEAIELREAGVSSELVLMEGCFDLEEYQQAAVYNLQLVIHTQQQLEAFLELDLTAPLKVWLKLDTGMHRLGFDTDEFHQALSQLKQSSNCHPDIVLMSHMACADDISSSMNQLQVDEFVEAVAKQPYALSMANSATIISMPDMRLDWVRPGLLLYGCSPMVGHVAQDHGLQPVMTFSTKVIAVKTVKAGEFVGYGSRWQATQDTHIAVLAVGYGDGYPRHAQDGTPVMIKGVRYPLVGRVAMDMMTVDIGDTHIQVGDEAILWGGELPAEEVATHADTISYTLFCGITRRVLKRVVE